MDELLSLLGGGAEVPPKPKRTRYADTVIEMPDGTEVRHRWWPYEKQARAHELRCRNVLYGGAVGGGKTRWLVEHVLATLLRWPGAPALICRRDLKDVKTSTEIEWQKAVNKELYDPRYGGAYNRTERWYRLFNGSKVYFGGMQDWESYKSSEFAIIAFDELTEIEEEAYDNMGGRLRWTPLEGPACARRECAILGDRFAGEHPAHPYYQRVAASNPAPGWVKQRFVDGWIAGKELMNYAYVPATTFENPSLPPDYLVSLLQDHSPEWVKSFVLGDWSTFEGAVFQNWSRATHVWRAPLPGKANVA
jgi:phage terminase large subunit